MEKKTENFVYPWCCYILGEQYENCKERWDRCKEVENSEETKRLSEEFISKGFEPHSTPPIFEEGGFYWNFNSVCLNPHILKVSDNIRINTASFKGKWIAEHSWSAKKGYAFYSSCVSIGEYSKTFATEDEAIKADLQRMISFFENKSEEMPELLKQAKEYYDSHYRIVQTSLYNLFGI